MVTSAAVQANEERAVNAILERGVLPISAPRGPSLVQVVTGGPIRGSWWGHEDGAEIFHLANALEDREDVWLFDLVGGRQTFVHRRLWPAVMAAAQSEDGLGATAQSLLAAVRAEPVRLDRWDGAKGKTRSAAAKELSRRLLVVPKQVHTESGRHARWLDTFERWASEEVAAAASALSRDEAIAALEAAAGESLSHLT